MKTPKPEKLPSGTWRIRMRLGGKSVSVTAKTKTECVNRAARIKAEFRDGKLTVTRTPVLRAAVAKYIENRRNVLSPSTLRGYDIIARSRFQSVMDEPLDSIEWQRAVNLEAKSCAPKTIRNALCFMRSVCKENGVVMPSVTLPAPDAKERAFLAPEEIARFVDAIHSDVYEAGYLLALHGLRRSEIYGLVCEDIKAGQIHVHQSAVLNEDSELVIKPRNKNQSSTRFVPVMIPRLLEVIGESGLVIEANVNTLNGHLQRITAAAGLPPITLHGLRHSFCSLCYSLGVSELSCMRLGGWSDYQTMRKIYTHISQAQQEKDVEKLSDFFKNAHETPTANPQAQQPQGF